MKIFLIIMRLTLQVRFRLKYLNLCKILQKLFLQLMQNLAKVKTFRVLELFTWMVSLYVWFHAISPLHACIDLVNTPSLFWNQDYVCAHIRLYCKTTAMNEWSEHRQTTWQSLGSIFHEEFSWCIRTSWKWPEHDKMGSL